VKTMRLISSDARRAWPRLASRFASASTRAAYGLGELRSDLERFAFLLGGSDGEQLFGP